MDWNQMYKDGEAIYWDNLFLFLMKSTKAQTLGELRMRGTANGGLGYWRLLAVSR